MKFRNTSDRALDFALDGERYTAAPRGLLIPDVPHEKVGGLRRIHGLPLEDAEREHQVPGEPVVRYHGPALRNRAEHALSFHVDGERHEAPPRGLVTPDVHPSKIDGVLRMGLPIQAEERAAIAAAAPSDDGVPAETEPEAEGDADPAAAAAQRRAAVARRGR